MNYIQFQTYLVERLRELLSEDYRVEIHPVVKNNNLRLDSLVILTEGSSISPNFYLQHYYQRYLSEEEPEKLTEEIRMLYRRAQKEQEKIFSDLSLSACRNRIIYRLVSYRRNEDALQKIPHIPFLDMAITFHCLILEQEDGIGSIMVSLNLQDKWGLNTKELFQIAQENTPCLFPKQICRMEELLHEMIQESDNGQELIHKFGKSRKGKNWLNPYVVTNQKGINGATVILYPDCLKELAEICQGDFYVLPSSIHEVIVIPVKPNILAGHLGEMVREVNQNCVEIDEILSDHVYRYSKPDGTLEQIEEK